MDDANDKIYPSNSYSNNRQKFPAEKAGYLHNIGYSYNEDEDNEEEEYMHNGEDNGDDDDDDDGGNGVQRISKDGYEYGNNDESDNDNDEFGDLERHAKKRKLKTLLSSYEFAPRVPAAPSPSASAPAPAPKPSYGGRNPLTDWSEHETFVLLNAWGEQFLKHGRKSLRTEEWQGVAEKVSQGSNIERTDTQCRNRLDTLKKKYKKEKEKEKVKLRGTGKAASEWMYFKKMDELLSPLSQQSGLSCGVDSGEYVFMNPKVYLNHSNELDEMQDSPGNSESAAVREDELVGLPTQKAKNGRVRGNATAAPFKLLADSIQKFSEVYLKIENSKRQQMVELEKMRMDFHRDLELQKKQILERAQAGIEKIRQGEDDDNDVSG